jgi:hypothetical protein
MTEHRIDLQPRKPNEPHFGGETMLFNGKAIGKSEKPLYDAARWLLANNAAAESDTVATYRGETQCMGGLVGVLAKWTVEERKNGRPSLRLVPYKAFSSGAVGSRTGETGSEGTKVPEGVS